MRQIFTCILLFIFGFSPSVNACDQSTIAITTQTDNGDGTITYCFDITIDIGGLDPSFYGFVLQFQSPSNTPVVALGTYPGMLSPVAGTSDPLTGLTGSDINSVANDSDWNQYENMTNVLSYEYTGFTGAASSDVTYNFCVTVDGCVSTVFLDASVNSGAPECNKTASTGISCLPCMADIGSTTVTGGTLVGSNEYDLEFGSTITFTQSGYTLPPAAGVDPADVVWAVFSCPPTNLTDPQADPCYLGVDFGDTTSDTNTGVLPSPSAAFSSVWLYPITFDDAVDGGNGTGVDVNGDGCIDSGDVFQLNYLPETLCDCADPSCPAGPNADDSNIQFTDCISPNTPYTNTTFTTCHTVTSDANGNLGVTQSVGGGGNMSCIDGMLASRTSELFLAVGGQCSGGPIPPDIANGGNSSTFNPEWNTLTPNTDYIICITVTIPDASCDVQEVCVDYYGEPVPCGTCINPDCPIGNVPTYADRSYQTCAIDNLNTAIPLTNCYLAQADATGFLGFANTLQNSSNDPFCLNGDIDATWELQALSDCGNIIPNPVPNANGTLSGFNPEYSGLTPNGQYVLCVTYDTNFPNDCTGINTLCLDYYGSDCTPPSTVSITGDNAPCSNSTDIAFSVPAEAGTTFTWTAPAGATISGQGTNSITVDFGTTSGDVCVTAANGCPDDQMDCFTVNLADITLSANSTPTTCGGNSDGTITLSSNGAPVLTYMWSPMVGTISGNTISDLPMGNYDITVTDANGCTAMASTTVNDGPSITLSANSTPTTCGGNSDGTITLSSNGAPVLTYMWSPMVGTISGNTISDLPMGNYDITVTDANGCTAMASTTVNDGPSITLSANSTPTTCGGNSDGTITLNSNGTPALNYMWSPMVGTISGNTISDLPMGNYDITVTDANGCTATASTTVNDGPSITLSANSTPTTCGGNSDGTITLNSNGTPALNYMWSPMVGTISGNTISDLPMGNYDITVTDANGCTAVTSSSVTDGPAITLSAIGMPTSCGGNTDGTITLSPNGQPAYTYAWSPMSGTISGNVISDLPNGNYSITVTDGNGCTAETTATVDLGSDPTVSATPTDASCAGIDNGSISASGSGGTPNYTYSIDGFSFQTSGIFSNLAPGNYTITIEDANGCTDDISVTVGVGSGPMVNANGTDESCPGENDGTISANGSGGTPNYMYSIDGINFQISGTFTDVGMGNYTITIQDANGCTNTTTVNIGVGVAPSITNIAPVNPSDCGVDDGSITVTASGTNLEYSNDGGATWQISNTFNGLSAGNYTILVRVVGSTNCTDMDMVTLTAPSAPSLTVASTDPTDCGEDDGTITITGTGTNLEYSIDGVNWFLTNFFDGLSAGNYTVMVREVDSPTCTASGNANLVAPMPPMITNVNSTDPTDCGENDGTITILPNNADWEYSIDGINWFNNNTFIDLAAGNYTVMVRLAAAPNCTDSDNTTLNAPNAPTIDNLVPTNPSDCGTTDGTIVVNATGINLEYSIDNGTTWQTGNLFSGLGAGNYTILIREIDSPNCGDSDMTTLTAPMSPTIDMAIGTDPSDCGVNDGTITINATGVNLEYSIDNGTTWQTSNTFNGLSAGSYTVLIREIGTTDCTDMEVVNLNAPSAPMITEVMVMDASDCGSMDGSITVTATGMNLEYSLDGVVYQTSNIFNGLNGGVYTVYVREVASPDCITTNNANIVAPDFPTITNVATTDPTDCGEEDGTITITATGVNLEYSIDGGTTWQTSNQFSGLSAGNYTPMIREIGTLNCTDSEAAVLFAPSAPIISDIMETDPTDCDGADGTITVTASGANLEYSLDGINYQSSNVFTGVAAGNYTVFVREIASPDCESTDVANLVTPVAPTIVEVMTMNPSDCGVNDGTITINANGTNLEYSNDGGTTWQASNMFTGLSAGNFTVMVREVGTLNCTDMEVANLTAPSAPVISEVMVTDATDCGSMDGSIIVTASGTNIEYSIDGVNFQMSPTFNGLNGGIYTITVREIDAPDCFTTDNANILAPIAPSITNVQTTDPSDCGIDNGTITITATGDNLEYSNDGGTTFQASNQFTDLAAGNYDIVVQVMNTMNCTATDIATLTAPSAPMITEVMSTNPSDCGIDDGTITITATGVDLEYSINNMDWFTSNIFMNVAGGMYTVYVREVASPECVTTDNATLVSPEMPIIVMVETTDPTDCGVDNGTITITATGNNLEYSIDNGATFQTSNVFDMLPAGGYGIVVREAGTVTCTVSENAVLNALTEPTISNVAATDLTDCNMDDGTITISANGLNLEYSIDGGVNFQTSNLFENLAANTYDIVVREIGTTMCIDTDMITIMGLNAPSITMVDSTNPSDCGVNDGTITITATGNNLEYSIDGNTWQVSNVFTGLSAGNYNVFVRAVGTMNCTDMDTAMLSTPNAPTISMVNSTDPTDCGVNDGTITITAMGTNLEYSIDGGITYFPSNLFEMLPAGNYVIMVREQASPTCTISDAATLNAPESPMITNLMTTDPSDCGIDDGMIEVTATGANLEYSIDGITWQASNIFNGLAAGNYTIFVRNANAINCTNSDDTVLNAPGAPIITEVAAVNPTDCGGDDGMITVMAMGTNLEYSLDGIMWQASNIFNGLVDGNYMIFVRDANATNCSAMDNAMLTAPTAPIISDVAISDPACGMDNGTITITGMGTNLEYSIDGGMTFQSSNSFTDLAGGDFDIVIREIGTMNCTDTDTATLTATAAPTIDNVAKVDPSGCGTNDGSITISPMSASLEYSIDGGVTFQASNIFDNLNDGSYDIVVQVAGTTNCDITDNAILNAPTAATIQNVVENCSADNTTYTVTFDIAGGDPTNFTITGNTGMLNGTTFTSDPISSGDAYSFVFSYAPNCPTAAISGVVVCDCPPIATTLTIISDFNGVNVSCAGGNDGSGSVSNINGGASPFTYAWSNGETAMTATALTNGTQYVTVTDANGCSNVDSVQLSAPPALMMNPITTATSCFDTEDGSVSFENVSGGTAPYLYSLNNAPLGMDTFYLNLPGGVYSAVVEDANGCEISQDLVVNQENELVVDLGPDQTINLGETVTLDPAYSTLSVDTFIWNPIEFLSCAGCENPVIAPTQATTYELTIADQNGCTASDAMTVFVAKDVQIHVPNVFSPNNDGVNDYVTVFAGEEALLVKTFMVFDRWGEPIYQAFNFDPNIETFGWDGTYRGKKMNPAVYVYFAEVVMLDGTIEFVKGDVTLIK